MMHILSLGAGVQSSTLALMAARGEITPMPDCAIFADTGAEPRGVYEWLDWLEKQLPFPVRRVQRANLRDELLKHMAGENRVGARPPFFTRSGGMLMRQCTTTFKVHPIQKEIREMLGIRPRQRLPQVPLVKQWIGISTDEAQRMKPNNLPFVENIWPLIDADMSRAHCLEWMRKHDYPLPTKSACTFCPYHDDALWRDMKMNDPESFADACRVDEAIRAGSPGPKRPQGDAWYVHRSLKPLAEVDFRNASDMGQVDLFGEECEGMCGV